MATRTLAAQSISIGGAAFRPAFLLMLLIAAPAAFGDDKVCSCVLDAIDHKGDSSYTVSGVCRPLLEKLIGPVKPLTPEKVRKLQQQACKAAEVDPGFPNAAGALAGGKSQVQELIDQQLQSGVLRTRFDQIDKDLMKIKSLEDRLDTAESNDRLWTALAALLAVLAIIGVILLALRKPAPAPDISPIQQDLKALNDRIAVADANARNALAKATESSNRIQQLVSQMAAITAQSNRPAGYSTSPNQGTDSPSAANRSGGKTVTPSQPVEPSSGVSQLVMAYNAAARSRRSSEYIRFESAGQNAAFFTVANARERAQNRDLTPAFRTVDTGPYFAVLNSQDQTYSVFPSLGKHPWGLRRDAAMNDVFDFPNVTSEPDLGVRKPATFRREGEDWSLADKGELEIL